MKSVRVLRSVMPAAMILLILGAKAASADERFDAVKRYWEWSAYWRLEGLDFPLATYKPGLTIKALVFRSAETRTNLSFQPYWGFCSITLGIWQAYSAWGNSTVFAAQATRIRPGENEQSALMRFERQEFTSDDEFTAVGATPPDVKPARRESKPSVGGENRAP